MSNSFLNLIDDFIDSLAVEKGMAKNSLEAYYNDIIALNNYFIDNKINILDSQNIQLRKYIHYLHEKQFATKTVARKISSIKQFYRFLYIEQIRSDNPSLILEAPKLNKSLPEFLNQDEIIKMLDVASKDVTEEGVRMQAMLEILYASGLRVSELIAIKMSDLQKVKIDDKIIFKDFIIITGKGNKERLVPLNKSALDRLIEYLALREYFVNKKNYMWLFPSRAKQGYITRQRFGQLLKANAIKAGIDYNKVHPHAIRHSFATHLLNNGADLRIVQELMGHADISSTQIYTHILDDKKNKLVLECHPLAEINKK